MLRQAAARYGDAEVIVRGDTRLTFSALERRSADMARGLLALGATKGTRIALWAPNCPDFVIYFMAAARIGAIVTPLSTLYQAPELAWILGHADIEILIAAHSYLNHDYPARLERAFPEIMGQRAGRLALVDAPYLRTVLIIGECDRSWAELADPTLAGLAASRREFSEAFLQAVEAKVVPADALCMIYTSGSTARPKGVVHGHGPMVRHTYQKVQDYWGMVGGDRFISLRPFFWVAGLSATLFHGLHSGGCLIVPPDASGATVARLIETEGATALCGDETWFAGVANDPVFKARGYEVYRTTMDCAALAHRGPAGPRFLNDRRATYQGEPRTIPTPRIARSYGMTETLGAHTSLPTADQLPIDRPRFNGRPVPGVVLRVVDPSSRIALQPGQTGELLVSGYCLMQGLYKTERSDVFTQDGFYPTGDLCSIDTEGYVAFSSRIGEMIKVRGANVAPLEVELTLNSLPGIERSAVVGAETAHQGMVLVAAVQMRPGHRLEEEAIQAALRTRLSSFKIPKRLFALAVEEFPTTASGKIKKKDLATLIAARIDLASSIEGSPPNSILV